MNSQTPPLPTPDDSTGPCTKQVSILTRVLVIGQLALVAATWKLWTPQTVFPQVPLIRVACGCPGWLDWFCLALLVGSSITLLAVGRRGTVSRLATAAAAVCFALYFVLDQHRLQPWAWQFFLLAVLLTVADDSTARSGWVWLTISIYFWSAVSKLDYTFIHDHGPALINGLKRATGLHGIPNPWTNRLDQAGSVGLAIGELTVAALLAWRRTRWIGLWAAIVMHAMLLAALGPLGLNHSLGVLLWNLFFIVQDWLLFPHASQRADIDSRSASPGKSIWRRRMTVALIVAMVTYPLLQITGRCDVWLAWAVYSGRADKAMLLVNSDTRDRLPANVDATGPVAVSWKLGRTASVDQVEVADWSLKTLGVPLYPQARFQFGIAIALMENKQFLGALVMMGQPNRLDGAIGNQTVVIIDPLQPDAVWSAADANFWNARPRWVGQRARNRIRSP